MEIEFLLLAAALLVLVKSSNATINSAVRFSALTGISQLALGFILISVATSLPEFSIAVLSSLRGEGILSLGNLAGANIANLTLIFGLMSFAGFNLGKIYSVKIDQAIIATSFIALYILVFGVADSTIGLFGIAVFYLFSATVMKEGFAASADAGIKTVETIKSLFYLMVSILIVLLSAHVVTDSAIKLSRLLGIAESVIGATVIAIGTTLPEMSVGIAAIRKGNVSLAVGDTIGSIVANMSLILGAAALLNPIALDFETAAILASLIAVNIIFLLLVYRMDFRRKEGIFLLSLFASYIALAYSL